jgi:ubiquinone/menaquinone biosynthesis C-methylase UbiE
VDPFDPRAVQRAYATVAEDYAVAFGDDLEQLPVDRSVLDEAAALVGGPGPVLDLGCGPGQVGQYVATRGRSVVGVDLAPEMLQVARQRGGRCLVAADLTALPFATASAAGALAYYCIQHVRRELLDQALAEVARVVMPGAPLALAAHLGAEDIIVTEFLGHHVDPVGGALYPADDLVEALARHAFAVHRRVERDPLAHEHQTRRLYLIVVRAG